MPDAIFIPPSLNGLVQLIDIQQDLGVVGFYTVSQIDIVLNSFFLVFTGEFTYDDFDFTKL